MNNFSSTFDGTSKQVALLVLAIICAVAVIVPAQAKAEDDPYGCQNTYNTAQAYLQSIPVYQAYLDALDTSDPSQQWLIAYYQQQIINQQAEYTALMQAYADCLAGQQPPPPPPPPPTESPFELTVKQVNKCLEYGPLAECAQPLLDMIQPVVPSVDAPTLLPSNTPTELFCYLAKVPLSACEAADKLLDYYDLYDKFSRPPQNNSNQNLPPGQVRVFINDLRY